MNIRICENLKELRKQKGNKQEELAEYLGVSMQAVSKWERGECYPDITLIPALALYYNVTSDKLLGMEENAVNAKIKEYYEEKSLEISLQHSHGDLPEHRQKQIALWREAQKEFPNNHKVLLRLLMAFALPNFLITSEDLKEIAQLGERLLRESTDNEIRFYTIQLLCDAYVSQKDFENAKKYADMVPPYYGCKEMLYGRCLEGEERIKFRQGNIKTVIDSIYPFFIQDMYGCNLSVHELISMSEFALKLGHLLYSDGDFGYEATWMGNFCQNLADWHAALGDTDKALFYLNERADYFIKSDHFVKNYVHEEFKHTSPMINRVTSKATEPSHIYSQGSIKTTIKMIEDNKSYDNIRNDEKFTAIVEKLKTLLQ